MKKGALLLVAALVLSLAAPGFAAVEMGGKIGSTFTLEKNNNDEWEVVGKTGIELETSLETDTGRPVRAVIQMKPWEIGELVDAVDPNNNVPSFDDDGNPQLPFDQKPSDIDLTLGVDKAWIETEGAFWNGGPTVSTRLGDVNISWDDYVGHLDDKTGVTVEGVVVGPVSAKAFYTYSSTPEDSRVGGAAHASIEGVDVEGMVVHGDDKTELSLGAGADVIPGLRLSGRLALDGEQRYLYRVQADSDRLIEGVKLTAAYRVADEDFQAMHERMSYEEDDEIIELWDKLTGFSVGVETTQSGIDIKASYDDPKKETNVEAATEIEGFALSGSTKLVDAKLEETTLKVGRHFLVSGFDIAGEYEGTIKPNEDMEHMLKASTTTDMLPYLRGLTLSAEVNVKGSSLENYIAAADYVAPNGIELGAEYHSVDGPSAKAGITVEF